MSQPCHYCTHAPAAGKRLNGLDRVDPRGAYDDANTVACCGVCNAMKLTFGIDEFLQAVRDIVSHCALDIQVLIDIERPDALGGTAERREATKDKTNDLPVDACIRLWADECYLCGRAPAFGIDRVDASLGYAEGNCRGCCTMCNYMKKDADLDKFLGHVARIYAHTARWTLGDTTNVLSGITGPRQPVAAFDPADGLQVIAFPSMWCAAKLVGMSQNGVTWRPVTVAQYKKQHLPAALAMPILRDLRGAGS